MIGAPTSAAVPSRIEPDRRSSWIGAKGNPSPPAVQNSPSIAYISDQPAAAYPAQSGQRRHHLIAPLTGVSTP
ncbi:hypothetical protein Axi01nite_69850 [Actinoplanes xinjiangensis]|nr:hypothetical protein Axi01nite_69850 [Actinoplanes xinjiangensis]